MKMDTLAIPAADRLHVRPLVISDLPDLHRIEGESYIAPLRESEAAFLSKMALFRAGSLGCFDAAGMCGYAFALPWNSASVIAVAQVVDALPARPDLMYIHDMVVAPAHRRRHVASTLLAEILRVAGRLDLHRVGLVAVQDSEPFWRRAGFTPAGRFEYVPGVPGTKMEMAVPPAAAPANVPLSPADHE